MKGKICVVCGKREVETAMTILDGIKERLKHDWDYVYAITGQSGCGMSLMSLSVGKAGTTTGGKGMPDVEQSSFNSFPAPKSDKKLDIQIHKFKRTCKCKHPSGWHFKGRGHCLECACLRFKKGER